MGKLNQNQAQEHAKKLLKNLREKYGKGLKQEVSEIVELAKSLPKDERDEKDEYCNDGNTHCYRDGHCISCGQPK